MSNIDVEEQAKAKCRYCLIGNPVRYRLDTNEYVHDLRNGPSFLHSICGANNLRKEYTAAFKDG